MFFSKTTVYSNYRCQMYTILPKVLAYPTKSINPVHNARYIRTWMNKFGAEELD